MQVLYVRIGPRIGTVKVRVICATRRRPVYRDLLRDVAVCMYVVGLGVHDSLPALLCNDDAALGRP